MQSPSVLFVCLGNICRSPTAEGIFRKIAPHVGTDSAGTSDWHVGAPPHPPMQAAARARGYDISDLRARQFEPGDFHRFDLILGMDDQNIADIETQRPTGSRTPVRRLTDFASHLGFDHVPDPYFTSDFDSVLDLIESAALGLRDHF
ncbi:low molecular weight protein-tyrosine-phosphatase [Roseovarius salinarum]|uniref:low molecular weight protein-tyrosine-phosphatase n=1 Tax=Roseovarius salinarum TaxID=1981892 RepID=UPI000C31D1B8|nr:low molecular weight protein-tyrosine-phosphatase [Roseovarius salinarum]